VRHLLAVQAQDPAAFPLALGARVSGLTARELAAAREAGAIVRCWGPRGTLHLIAADDLRWLCPLVKPTPAGSLRRLRQLGVDIDIDTAVSVTESALAGQGPLAKPELGERLAKAGLAAQGQAIVHLAMLSAGRGKVVLGPERDGKATYVHAGDWLGTPVPAQVPEREAAMRRLVVRYRRAHAAAGPADLAAWSGLPRGSPALPSFDPSGWRGDPIGAAGGRPGDGYLANTPCGRTRRPHRGAVRTPAEHGPAGPCGRDRAPRRVPRAERPCRREVSSRMGGLLTTTTVRHLAMADPFAGSRRPIGRMP
jgi:hypothetical protein